MKIYVSDKENIDLSKKCYLTFSTKDKETVDWNVLAQSLEQHDKELLKAFGNEIIEWFAQYHTYEGISVHKCIERLLKERGVE